MLDAAGVPDGVAYSLSISTISPFDSRNVLMMLVLGRVRPPHSPTVEK